MDDVLRRGLSRCRVPAALLDFELLMKLNVRYDYEDLEEVGMDVIGFVAKTTLRLG